MTLITPKVCAQCPQLFTPRRPTQRCCSFVCARRWEARARKGVPPTAAIVGAQEKREAALVALVGHEFGELSERERALYAFVWRVAYVRGYNRAYHEKFLKATA